VRATTKAAVTLAGDGTGGPRAGMAGRPVAIAVSLCLAMVSLAACTSSPSTSAQAAPPQSAQAATSQSAQAAAIAKIVQNAMKTDHLKAVVIKVTKGGNPVTTQAFGDSMDGVPATTAMHFRNGAVAFEYVATLLMELVDEHKVTLNDTIQRWMPTLPEAGQVTLKMLANQTTGYPDFETDPAWLAAFNADPFHVWKRHGHHRGRGWHRRAAVEIQLPCHD
jgi:CubicO group peptidase (beta-lactamase class C family)